MNLPKSALIGLVALVACTRAFAQASLQGDALRDALQLTGLGIVGPAIGETDCGPNASGSRAVPLFRSIGGPATARFEWRTGDHGSCFAFLVRDGTSERLYRAWDHPEIEYESLGLTYYEAHEGFARVFARTAPPGLWVRVGDLPGPTLRTWSEILTESPRNYRGYDGVVLHEQPREGSPALVALRAMRNESLRHQLTPTGELSGTWGEFEVVELDGDLNPLTGVRDASPTGNRWKGWLRVVSPDGAPEFWFYTRD
jgi:hypothetical protein